MDNLMENLAEKMPSIQGKVCDNYTYSPVEVTMHNTVGMVFMGIVSILLFVALLISQKRYQALVDKFH
jgi:Ni/Fe-hydrogenase subunit HybB-like protein